MNKFPNEGDFFGVTCSYMRDYSYREDIFQCVASDESRVVCLFSTRVNFENKPMVLHRSQWHFEDVSALLPSLGLCNLKESERIADAAILKAAE